MLKLMNLIPSMVGVANVDIHLQVALDKTHSISFKKIEERILTRTYQQIYEKVLKEPYLRIRERYIENKFKVLLAKRKTKFH